MKSIIHAHRSRFSLTVAIAVMVSVFSGCSRSARMAKALDRANRYYAAGDYDKAEIEYKNVLQNQGANPNAIARLGAIYLAQGNESRAIPFLLKAKQLEPGNPDTRLRLGLIYATAGAAQEAREEALFVLDKRPQDPDAPTLLVEAAGSNAKELQQARERLTGLPEAATNGAPVVVALGIIDLRQNRVKDAEAAFARAQTLDPNSAVAASALGMLRWAQNDLPAAEAALKKAADLSPPRSPRRLKYAQFKIQTGKTADARRVLEEMSRKTPDYLSVWIWLAEVAAAEKQYNQGEGLLAKVFSRDPYHPEATLLSARISQAKGEPEKAVAKLEKLHSVFPNLPQITYQLGTAYAANGEITKAINSLTEVVAAAPGMAHAVLALAELNIRRRDFGAAILSLKQLAQERADLPTAQVLLAEAYRGQGDLDNAAAIFARLERQFPNAPQTPYWRGIVLVQKRDFAGARKAFDRAHELAPKSISAMEQLVDLDLREHNPAAARQRVEQQIENNPTASDFQLLLAKIQLIQGEKAAAEATLKHAAEIDPQTPAPLFTLAQIYAAENQQEKALETLEKVVSQYPRHTGAALLKGIIHEKLKDYPAARDMYEKVIAIDPRNAVALNNLGYLCAEHLNQLEKGFEFAQRARAIAPTDPNTADSLGWIQLRRKQYGQALDLLKESAAKLPKTPEAQFHLGVAHYEFGEEGPARTALSRALELNGAFSGADDARQRLTVLAINRGEAKPENRALLEKRIVEYPGDSIALTRLGDIYQKDGEIDKAMSTYRTAVQANPKNANALINIARLYEAKQDLPKALESAKAARALAPDDLGIAHTVGRLGFKAGDHRWAASLLDDVARKQPDNADVLFDLGEAVYSTGRVNDAEAAFGKALKINPSSTRAGGATKFLELVEFSTAPAKAVAASAKIEQIVKADPANVPALMAMAAVYEQRADAQAALQNYEKVLGIYPEFSPALKQVILLSANNPADNPKAFGFASKARQAYPNDIELARAVGIIAYRQGDFTRAANLLQETAAQRTSDGELMYYLGMSQFRLNKPTESKQSLQRALELGLKDTLAAEARKNIALAK